MRRIALAATLATLLPAAQAGFLHNGGLEDLAGNWADTTCNYMAVAPGSSVIDGWTVSTGATGPMVWGRSTTCDGYAAAEGSHFVDLSGFGTDAGLAAALEQTLNALVAGETYTVSLQYYGAAPTIAVDGVSLGAAGAGVTSWTTLSGSFVAGGSTALLSLRNVPSSGFVFVDDVQVSGPSSGTPVPAPASLALAGLALALALTLGTALRPRTRR